MAERDVTHRLRRAVKENNLALVKRLIQRADIRNPDPGPCRYTSLAWAAVLGHEETFEYLLQNGHDDEELSKDAENNTILILLAGQQTGGATPSYRNMPDDAEVQGAAMRMARLYWERYPFILDWANLQGRTALHVAALKGREDFVRMICDLGADFDLADVQGNTPLHHASSWGHVPVVQLLIERGCGFNAKNNDGFTASDYAYSHNTQEALQETARNQWESNKKSRVEAKHAARTAELRDRFGSSPEHTDDVPRRQTNGTASNRLRSGSQTTSTSDSTDYDGPPSISAQGSQFSAHSSSGSLPRLPPSNGTVLTPIPSSSAGRSERSPPQGSVSSAGASTSNHGGRPSMSGRPSTALGLRPSTSKSSLSPVASRMLERDAGAMAQYLQRQRSGSHSSVATAETNHQPQPQPTTTYAPASSPPPTDQGDLRSRLNPLLRPSVSAASLRLGQAPVPVTVNTGSPRIRAGTLNTGPPSAVIQNSSQPSTVPRPLAASSAQAKSNTMPLPSNRRPVLPVGRIADSPSNLPNGHSRRPSGSVFKDPSFLRLDSM